MGADNVTRRGLLTAGGLTLLGIYAADPARRTAAAPSTPDARPSPAGLADALTTRDRHRTRAAAPPTRQPHPPPPHASRTRPRPNSRNSPRPTTAPEAPNRSR